MDLLCSGVKLQEGFLLRFFFCCGSTGFCASLRTCFLPLKMSLRAIVIALLPLYGVEAKHIPQQVSLVIKTAIISSSYQKGVYECLGKYCNRFFKKKCGERETFVPNMWSNGLLMKCQGNLLLKMDILESSYLSLGCFPCSSRSKLVPSLFHVTPMPQNFLCWMKIRHF